MTLSIDTVPPGFPVDEIYARLVAMGNGRPDEDARAMLSALALVLINQIADPQTVIEAIDLVETAFKNQNP
jgi:hypothetical protein